MASRSRSSSSAGRTITRSSPAIALLLAALPQAPAVQPPPGDPRWTADELKERIAEVFTPEERRNVQFVRSRNYVAIGDSASLQKIAKIFDDEVYGSFRRMFPAKVEEDPRLLPLYLFATKESYWAYCQRMLPTASGMFDRIAIGHAYGDDYATYPEKPRDPVHFHELALQILRVRMRLKGGGVWFHKGVAEHFENHAAKLSRGADVRAAIKAGGFLPLRTLFASTQLVHDSGTDKRGFVTAGGRYGQSSSLIQFLLEGPMKERFSTFFVAAGRAKEHDADAMEKVIHETYGVSLEELERRWKEWFAK